MLESIVPSGVIHVEGPILVGPWNIAPAEEAVAAAFGPKRKAEFLTGRAYARQAQSMLGADAPPLGVNIDRSPIWPKGMVGCITHSRDYCAVAVAKQTVFRGIGLDIEGIGRVTEKIQAKVFTDSEREALATDPESLRKERMTAVFCAKESFYKLQYPLTKSWLGFLDVAVTLEAEGKFVLKLNKDIGTNFSMGQAFAGRFIVAGERVAALMVL